MNGKGPAITTDSSLNLVQAMIAQFERVDKNIETMAAMISANLTVLNARVSILEGRINNLSEMQGVGPLKYSIRCNEDTKIVVDKTSLVRPSNE
jgi:hypothetical protein